MKSRNIIIASFALLAMSSCGSVKKWSDSLYGKYERPDSIITEGIVRDPVNDKATLAGSNDFGNLPWRQVFTDPQLQTLIEKALANNTDLRNAALNVEMAEAQLKSAKLAFLPTVSFTPQGTLTHFGTHMETTKAYTLPIVASWNVDLWGNIKANKRSAESALIQSQDNEVAIKTSLICNVANLYYTLLSLDRQVEIVKEMQDLTKDTWDMMKLQMEYGSARATSVQSAEASYYSVLTQSNSLNQSIRETENSLSLLLGEPAHAIPRGKLDDQSLPTNFSGGVGAEILSNRPDVHAYEMSLAQCFYAVESARSQFYPQLTITGTGGWSNNSGLVNPGKLLLNAVGSLVQPIFQQGKLKANLRVSKAQYQQALNNWQQSVLQAGSEVSNALVAYNSADANDKLERQQIEVLKQNVEQTQMLYRQSSSTYLEVITAEQNLLNAQLSQVQDQFSKMQAVVNLYYALGGGRE